MTTISNAFKTLDQTGVGVIDIGARYGLHPIFKEAASLIDAIGFEPDVGECERLNKEIKTTIYRSLKFFPFGLGRADGLQTLHLCRSKGFSSFYKPNRAFLARFPDPDRFDVQASLSVPVRSFDAIKDDQTICLPQYIDFMKIDTQGFELDILQGARVTLCGQVVAVEVEVEFARRYESQPVFRDVDSFLSECGFTLFKLRREEWVRRNYEDQPQLSAGQLIFGDALYLRDPLNKEIPWMPKDAHQAEALVLLAVLYDLHDFAMEIISEPTIASMLEPVGVSNYILQRSKRLNRPLSRFLRHMKNALNGLKPYRSQWARGDHNFYTGA